MTADDHVDDTDQLVNLLRGDVDRIELARTTAHLRSCDQCLAALVDLLPAHAALTATARLLRAAEPVATEPPTPLPQVDDLPVLPRPRRRPVALLIAAAVVAILALGGGIGLGVQHYLGSPPPSQRSVALAPVTGDATGRVTMAEQSRQPVTTMKITTDGLAAAGAGQFYYAWLFDPDTNKMLPLGVVAPDGSTRFQVSDDLVSRYHAVDISLQDDNGNPAHSDTSVLRASY